MNKIREVVFEKHLEGYREYIPFSEFAINVLPTDFILIQTNEAYTTIKVIRERDKTPEEMEKTREYVRQLQEKSKNERREQYLKLKKEFGNE